MSVAASIVILFANTSFPASSNGPVLPFALVVGGFKILFDDLDSSPVFESGSSEADSRAPRRSPSYGHTDPTATTASGTSQDSMAVVEADAATAFEVRLPPAVLANVVSQCTQCYGYTVCGNRCLNKRRPASGKRGAPVWCHHHTAQERAFYQFLFAGDRPSQCEWWELYDYEELVKERQKSDDWCLNGGNDTITKGGRNLTIGMV